MPRGDSGIGSATNAVALQVGGALGRALAVAGTAGGATGAAVALGGALLVLTRLPSQIPR